jgi:thiol-disulfide isomerase/thioredoxin
MNNRMKGGRKFTHKKRFKGRSVTKKGVSGASKKGKFIKVESIKDISKFEHMLKTSPVTIIMVHLDWCGHCKRAAPSFMEVAKQNHPGVNFAMLNGDIQGETSIKSIKVEGVPEFVVHANANGNSTSSKVPISYEKADIEKLAVASSNAINQMRSLPQTMAIDVIKNIRKNKSATVAPASPSLVTMSNSALPVPNAIVSEEGEAAEEEFKELYLPEKIPTLPTTTKSMNFMSATSPMATLMNITSKGKTEPPAGELKGGSAPSIVNMVASATNPRKFFAKVKGTTLTGSAKSIMKAIKKMK